MKFLKLILVPTAMFVSASANAALVEIATGNDGISYSLYLGNDSIMQPGDIEFLDFSDGVVGGQDVTQLNRVNWNDADSTNPQVSGGLSIFSTITEESTQIINEIEVPLIESKAIDWTWDNTFGTLDFLSIKFDGAVVVYDLNGATSGSWDSQYFCNTHQICTNNDGGFAFSHSAAYTVVPVPAAVWLFGSGLIGLIGIARRKKA